MNDTRFENQVLRSAQFRNVDMQETLFNDVNLQRAVFQNINLQGAAFTDINFSHATITESCIEGLKIWGIEIAPLIKAELERRSEQSKEEDAA